MRVLIVEDDMIIAGNLGPIVTDAGHDLVGLAADRDTAVALLSTIKIDLALIDLHLADGWTGVDVARAAAQNGVAAVFATANPALLPQDFAGAHGVITKPYRNKEIRSALDYIAIQIRTGAILAAPPGLELGPRWSEPDSLYAEASLASAS